MELLIKVPTSNTEYCHKKCPHLTNKSDSFYLTGYMCTLFNVILEHDIVKQKRRNVRCMDCANAVEEYQELKRKAEDNARTDSN